MLQCLEQFDGGRTKSILDKQWSFTKMGLSIAVLSVTSLLMTFVTLMFAGKLGQAHLDGVGLTNTMYNIVMVSVWFGCATVFDTYAPQVYGSAKKHELGTILLKCLLQGAMIYLFILGPYLNLVHLIDILPHDSSLGQTSESRVAMTRGPLTRDVEALDIESRDIEARDTDFRVIAVEYLRTTCLNGYLDYITFMLSKYFAIQGGEIYVYIVSAVIITSQILSNYVLVSVCGLGLQGIELAAFIARLVSMLFSIGICVVNVRRGVFIWSRFSWKVLSGWLPMLKLDITGIINVFAELCLLEIATFLSQFAGATTLSVVLICFQVISVLWAVTAGVCGAATAYIGTALGEGSKSDVKTFIALSIGNVVGLSVTLAVITYNLSHQLVRLFTSESDVIQLFVGSFWLVCLGIPFDHLQTVLNRGVLTAFGEQRLIALSISILTVTIGLPIIACNIFLTDLKVIGIYTGFLVYFLCNITVPLIRISRYDLDKEIERTRVRVTTSTARLSITSGLAVENGLVNPAFEWNGNEGLSELPSLSEERTIDLPTPKRSVAKEHRNVILGFLLCLVWFVVTSVASLLLKP